MVPLLKTPARGKGRTRVCCSEPQSNASSSVICEAHRNGLSVARPDDYTDPLSLSPFSFPPSLSSDFLLSRWLHLLVRAWSEMITAYFKKKTSYHAYIQFFLKVEQIEIWTSVLEEKMIFFSWIFDESYPAIFCSSYLLMFL